MEFSEQTLFIIDIAASMLGLAYIILATKQNNWCWPAAFISSSLYIFLFISSKLYFDAVLNGYYVIMAIYGLWSWNKSEKETTIKVNWGGLHQNLFGVFICGIIAYGLGYFANNYTDADFAYADAFTTIFSFFATWLVTQKRIENWIYWIIIDSIALILYLEKGLFFTSGLFVLYLGFAVFGYFEWRKELLKVRVEKP